MRNQNFGRGQQRVQAVCFSALMTAIAYEDPKAISQQSEV
jgi:hypothetical protein